MILQTNHHYLRPSYHNGANFPIDILKINQESPMFTSSIAFKNEVPDCRCTIWDLTSYCLDFRKFISPHHQSVGLRLNLSPGQTCPVRPGRPSRYQCRPAGPRWSSRIGPEWPRARPPCHRRRAASDKS